MPDINIIDATGSLPTIAEVEEAQQAVDSTISKDVMSVPPELAVHLLTIKRCLSITHAVVKHMNE